MSIAWLKEIIETDRWAIEELNIVYDGEWVSEGKYEYKETVVELTGAEVLSPEDYPVEATLEPGLYQINDTRSGSYYSDWEYGEPSIFKVEPYTETVTRYRELK